MIAPPSALTSAVPPVPLPRIADGIDEAARRGVDRGGADDVDGAAVLGEDPRLAAGQVDRGGIDRIERGRRDDRIAQHVDRLAGADGQDARAARRTG